MHLLEALPRIQTWLLNYLLNCLWQAPLLFAAAWLATRPLRRRSPAAEHRIWVATLFLQLTLPAITLSPRQLLNALEQLIPWHTAHTTTTALITITTGPAQAHTGLELPAAIVALILAAYALTLLYFAARLLHGLRNTAALSRNTQPIALTPEAAATWSRCAQHFHVPNAQLAESTAAPYPLTIGLRSPRILLPKNLAATISPDDLAAALAHEFAHIHRRDFAKNLAYAALSIPIAFHPILWLTRTRIEETREILCDTLAAQALTGAEPYARSLLRLAALFIDTPHRNLHAIGIFDTTIFERRLMNLTQKPTHLRTLQRIALTIAVLTLGIATCASALALRLNVTASATSAPAQTPEHSKALPVQARVINGQRITFVEPVYPASAKKAKLNGTVVLAAVIGKDGTIKSLHVFSSTSPIFDSAALKAVRRWTYKPYLLNGKPVEVDTHITVNFALNPEPKPEPSPDPSSAHATASSDSPMHIGGEVTRPVVLNQVEPEYSKQAKAAKFSGDVEVYLVVDKEGHPANVRVVKGVGMGLDEKAVEAVRQYRFKPATLDGRPVPVDLYIDVNFKIL
ncbi:MAG: M56 family metallopeptidase [Acidobacteriaceae bacterium]